MQWSLERSPFTVPAQKSVIARYLVSATSLAIRPTAARVVTSFRPTPLFLEAGPLSDGKESHAGDLAAKNEIEPPSVSILSYRSWTYPIALLCSITRRCIASQRKTYRLVHHNSTSNASQSLLVRCSRILPLHEDGLSAITCLHYVSHKAKHCIHPDIGSCC